MSETKSPAKRTPAKKAAPAKKAPAKKAAPSAGTKLRWTFPEGFAERARTGQTAVHNGGELAMKPMDGKWTATWTKGGATTVLAEGVSAAKAYAACIEYSRTGTKSAA